MKVQSLVVVAVVSGLLLGTLEGWFGHMVWPMMIGLCLLLVVLCNVAQQWVTAPLESLASQLERHARSDKPTAMRRLPTRRDDEVGRIARAVQAIGEASVRHRREAATLRKTLESKTIAATRRATAQLERLARRDPLTDLGNRRCLDEQLDALITDAREQADPLDLICVLFDVDNFKPLNDTLGHAAGDEVLAFLASLIRGCARSDDLAVRLGGDEFVVLLPAQSSQRAEQYTNTVRALFRQQTRLMFPGGPAIDLSIGVAGLRRDGCADGDGLLAAADANLYRAKRAGKGATIGLDDAVQVGETAPPA